MTDACGVVSLTHTSEVLRRNPLGDPATRELIVLTPPGYQPGTRRYPTVYWLAGFGSRGRDLLGGGALAEPLPEMLGRLMLTGDLPAALVVLPDCSTRYGGSQYLDSPGCGRYQEYLVDELIPHVETTFATLGAGARAVVGKSSGGYGALMAAVQRPGSFSAVCAHSPDAGFEFCYLSLFPAALDTIGARGGFDSFAADPRVPVPKDGSYMVAMSLVAMAACFGTGGVSADGYRLADEFPCDPRTGMFRDEVWQRWLAHDPVRAAGRARDRLSRLDLLFLDVGRRDDYGMHWGARALHDALGQAGVSHHFEEHDGGHHGIEHRFVRSLSLLARCWSHGRKV